MASVDQVGTNLIFSGGVLNFARKIFVPITR